jgi:hypothetical protein
VILYWFGPPQSKTLHPVLDCIDLIVAKVEVEVEITGRCPWERPCLPYIGRRIRSVDRSPGRLQHGNLSLVGYNIHGSLSEPP